MRVVKSIDAVILSTARVRETVAFYRVIGLPLDEELHSEGPLHYAGELGRPVELNQAPKP